MPKIASNLMSTYCEIWREVYHTIDTSHLCRNKYFDATLTHFFWLVFSQPFLHSATKLPHICQKFASNFTVMLQNLVLLESNLPRPLPSHYRTIDAKLPVPCLEVCCDFVAKCFSSQVKFITTLLLIFLEICCTLYHDFVANDFFVASNLPWNLLHSY